MRTLKVGQRVKATFSPYMAEPKLGVVSQCGPYSVSVQFAPCDAHWGCKFENVSAFGDVNGWTDQEYRVERERSYCRERAANVESERREKFPDAPFSAYAPREVAVEAEGGRTNV